MSLKSNLQPDTEEDEYNSTVFVIESVLNNLETIDLVRVVAINENGTINVKPIVQSVNAAGEPILTPLISNVRYIRLQAGANAILMTPQVGDVGLFCVCKKDISNAENGIVGSYRTWNLSDGVYLGSIFNLNQAPTTFIELNGDINITGTNVTVNATTATIKATNINLGENATQGVARIGDSVDLQTGKITTGSSIVKSL